MGVVSNKLCFTLKFFACSDPHVDRCSNPLLWDPLSSPLHQNNIQIINNSEQIKQNNQRLKQHRKQNNNKHSKTAKKAEKRRRSKRKDENLYVAGSSSRVENVDRWNDADFPLFRRSVPHRTEFGKGQLGSALMGSQFLK